MRSNSPGTRSGVRFGLTFPEAMLMILMCATANSFAHPLAFEGQTNVGRIQLAGSVLYDSLHGTYRVTGSGENMWGDEDAFFFVWRRVSGDLILKTSVSWEGQGKHRAPGKPDG